jgi:transcriptional regulator with XRE-family HTH domain
MSKSRKIKEIKRLVIIHDNEYYYNVVRKNIKKYRNEKNLTQEELADMAGISRCYMTDIENEKRKKHPSVEKLTYIADALDINIMELFRED